MLRVAEQTWKKLNAPELLPLVASGATFTDGTRDEAKQSEDHIKCNPNKYGCEHSQIFTPACAMFPD
jgi:hypothetical protein